MTQAGERGDSMRVTRASTGSRDHLPTEQPNPRAQELDRLSICDAFDVVNAEDQSVALAVARARPEIVKTVEIVATKLGQGGRLFYVGAGTSGRLAVLDAAELPPTFQCAPEQVQGVIAGGERALTTAVEGAEDGRELGAHAMDACAVGARDVVLGITAGGTTPYVHGALARARALGAATVLFACVPFADAPDDADVSIRVVTGPEVVSGSTRMKAGTATKMVLNTISTLAMVKLGKTFGPWMIDVNARGNAKLWQRGISLVQRLTGFTRDDAEALLTRADGQVKVAVAMAKLSCDASTARAKLTAVAGRLRDALERERTS